MSTGPSWSQRAVKGAALAVLTGVLATSITGLAEVAALVHMPALGWFPLGTIGLVLAFDGMQVLASVALHMRRTWPLLVLLVVMALASGAVQGFAAVVGPGVPEEVPRWFTFAMHAAPAVLLIAAEAVVMSILRATEAAPAVAPEGAADAPTVAPPAEVVAARPAPPAEAPVSPPVEPSEVERATPRSTPRADRRAAPRKPARGRAGKGAALTDEQVITAARSLDVAPGELTATRLRDEYGIGWERAKRLLPLAARPPLVAVDGGADR